MSAAEQPQYPSGDPAQLHRNHPDHEQAPPTAGDAGGVGTLEGGEPPGGGDASTAVTVEAIAARVDAIRSWAATTQSHLRGVIAAQQVAENRFQQLGELRGQVDALAASVAEMAAPQPHEMPVDGAIGYKPSPHQQAALFAHLAEWQQQAKSLEKSHTANIETRAGATVSYRYADISSVSEIARSAGDYGLAHFHREIVISGQNFIRTYLVHRDGGWISCDVPLLTKENTLISSLQQWASACTMARRYGLFMVLGIAAGDEDDDGQATTTRPRTATRPAAATQSSGPSGPPAGRPAQGASRTSR